LNIETTKLDEINTNVVAEAIEKPYIALVVTARVGHIPNTITNTGFSLQSPFANSLKSAMVFPCNYLPNTMRMRIISLFKISTTALVDIVAPVMA
jgi:hypothetical protein